MNESSPLRFVAEHLKCGQKGAEEKNKKMLVPPVRSQHHGKPRSSKYFQNHPIFLISLQNFRLISGPMLPLFPRMEKPLKIIGSRQHGCTKGRMIKEHLLTANSFLHKTFAAKLSFWMISLDLSKALDRVDWETLCGTVLAFRLSTQIHFQICDISNVALYSPLPIWPNMVV